MTPRGAEHLISMRKDGVRPAGPVWVSFGDFRDPWWFRYADTLDMPEIVVRPTDPLDRIDLRCVVGLSVILFGENFTSQAAVLYEKLKQYAHRIEVMFVEFDEDIGWRWSREAGEEAFFGGDDGIATA